jgi:hypothetical protein
MTNVVIGRKRTVHISTNATSGIIDSSQPVVLKPTPTLTSAGPSTRLDHLKDVDPTGEVQGATLVYDYPSDTYVVKQLNMAYIVGPVDGGNF